MDFLQHLQIALTPAQTLRCLGVSQLETEPELTALLNAFAMGSGAGLVRLAGSYPTAMCDATTSYWRDLAKVRLMAELSGDNAQLTTEGIVKQLAAAPPMTGGEYLSAEVISKVWNEIGAYAASLPAHCGAASLHEALSQLNPAWDTVARVCLSLAENRSNADLPFALLATYTTRLSGEATPKHAPLARVLKEQAKSGQTAQLTRIHQVLTAAAAQSPLVAEWVESRKIYQPIALKIDEAYRFLRDAAALEEAGLMVRLPDWWQRSGGARPQVQVTVGANKSAGTGAAAMLDFKVDVTLLGKPLSRDEWKTLKDAVGGLVFLRGRWIEANAERLSQVLKYWQTSAALTAGHGIPFAKALRLLVGGGPGSDQSAASELPPEEHRRWSDVVAGPWLTETLRGLRDPQVDLAPSLEAAGVQARLRDYQLRGVAWLERLYALGLGGCLADDMGLGKTLQVLAFFALRRHHAEGLRRRHLVVAPATLLANWLSEAAKFTPQLATFAAHPSAHPSSALRTRPKDLDSVDLVVTTYGALQRYPWLQTEDWNIVVLDEAQAIKNPNTKQTRAVKELPSFMRIALTGTPIENHPLDLWSIFDFINPGLLGNARQFSEFLAADDQTSYRKAAARLRTLVQPYILRRLKTDKAVIADLPPKTEVEVICGLIPAQAALYERVVSELRRDLAAAPEGIQRRGVVLASLLKLKQICNHPCLAIGHGDYSPRGSGKLLRLLEIAAEIAARQEKLLIFTQFREMTAVLERELTNVFGARGVVLHGDTPIAERKALVDAFQSDGGPPFFVLSLKAGGTGLTLTAANHVIHFDRWWNPAVEDQATDRAYRLGQNRHVLVHKLACAGTIEAKIAQLLADKRGVARDLLGAPNSETIVALSNDELLELVSLDLNQVMLTHEEEQHV